MVYSIQRRYPTSDRIIWTGKIFLSPTLAYEVIRRFVDESEVSDKDLRHIVKRSYSTFRHPDTVPLVTLDKAKNLHLLELFHGPTFAFKDVALQFLGNLFEFFLVRKNEHIRHGQQRHHLTVIGATSGDTGSAAIYGLRGKKDVSIFITFPDGKVSPVQEAQMTTVLDPNVHCLSVEGTFDDCQDLVKALFGDAEMNKGTPPCRCQFHKLGSDTGSDHILLLRLFPAAEATARIETSQICSSDREFWGHLSWILCETHGIADREIGHCNERKRHIA